MWALPAALLGFASAPLVPVTQCETYAERSKPSVLISGCLALLAEAAHVWEDPASVNEAEPELALHKWLLSTYTYDGDNKVTQPYVVHLTNLTEPEAVRITHPYLETPAADKIVEMIWLLPPDGSQGLYVGEAARRGELPGGVFTTQGQFDSHKQELVASHRKTYLTQFFPRVPPLAFGDGGKAFLVCGVDEFDAPAE